MADSVVLQSIQGVSFRMLHSGAGVVAKLSRCVVAGATVGGPPRHPIVPQPISTFHHTCIDSPYLHADMTSKASKLPRWSSCYRISAQKAGSRAPSCDLAVSYATTPRQRYCHVRKYNII